MRPESANCTARSRFDLPAKIDEMAELANSRLAGVKPAATNNELAGEANDQQDGELLTDPSD